MNVIPRNLTRLQTLAAALTAVGVAAMLIACGSQEATYVRGDEVPGIDKPAMGTGLDKEDLARLFDENANALFGSKFYRQTITDSERHSIAIFPFKNETSEHVGPQLQALLSKIETQIVNDGEVDVISHERQQEMIRELQMQQSDLYNPSRAAQIGKRLGVDYFITGKVYDAAERTSDVRRVQYFLFMQAIDVETGAIRWQREAELTKALVPVD